ncbi:uncharacterized protein LOC123428262 [Hordeum vulgare subsp. vulgare]|uniref:uncharacterized protein LOC123428262 n=1 Tax=Hordeum vulgare subsp. vulgare TaxID=112509 RepID=UPI001D1A335C|nr:uncharacterized protein LOC123428262 [Hordeum vulgare subsp. vulgare]
MLRLRSSILAHLLSSSPVASPVSPLHCLISATAPAIPPNPSGFAMEEYLRPDTSVGRQGLRQALPPQVPRQARRRPRLPRRPRPLRRRCRRPRRQGLAAPQPPAPTMAVYILDHWHNASFIHLVKGKTDSPNLRSFTQQFPGTSENKKKEPEKVSKPNDATDAEDARTDIVSFEVDDLRVLFNLYVNEVYLSKF